MIDPNPKQKKEITCKLAPRNAYAFTFNPSNEHQCFQTPKQMVSDENRLEKFKNKLSKSLQYLQDNEIEYFVNVECSEPLNGVELKPRLHVHGIIYFPNVKSIRWFLLYGLYYLTAIGQIEIDTINDLPYWTKYCYKQVYLELGYLTNKLLYKDLECYVDDLIEGDMLEQ